MNSDLAAALSELADIYTIMGQEYKARAYHKAVIEIKKKDVRITTDTPIAGVGEHIRAKIAEYLSRGKIAELVKLKKDPHVVAYRELSRVLGVGPATIDKWWDMKIRNLGQLRTAVAKGKIKLTNMQKYGLRYYEDLNKRIPREEVYSLGEYVKQLLIQIDPQVVFTIAGSYRRGAETSGDIDILVSNRTQFIDDLLESLVGMLSRDPNFVDVISGGVERVTFLYKYAGTVRQIDVLNIKYPSYYAALVYFTGGFEFNTVMRGHARANGYRLNQNGLYRVAGDQLELIATNSEREVFELIGLAYIPPAQRNDPVIVKL